MFRTLIEKELKIIIQSPKFILTFVTATILILLSVGIGISEYKSNLAQYNTAVSLEKQQMEQAKSWHSVETVPFRKPNPLQIFSSGVNFDIGRFSYVSQFSDIKLQNSYYSDDPIFAIFRHIDFTFIVTIVFSLLAILFTYNLINGEREDGTLKLIFSNSVSRANYILAKFAGAWLGLVFPLIVSILLGCLMVLLFNIPFTSGEWQKLFFLILVSLLYFSFFIAFGIFVSASTKKSSISFLILLISWIAFVFIIPRAGVMTAGQLVEVPSISQIESMRNQYETEQWDEYFERQQKLWTERQQAMEGMSEAERTAYEDEHSWEWMEEDDKSRKQMQNVNAEYSRKLRESYNNQKSSLQKLAFQISRLSPASAYQLAAMKLSGHDVELKRRYENQMQEYKNNFLGFIDEKSSSDVTGGGIRITMDSENGFQITDGRKESKLDISEVPKFKYTDPAFANTVNPAIIDLGLIFVYILAAFSLGVLRFIKYDVR